MPKREDIKSVMVIGSGPIIIGQACEFDYSGTQACRVLKEEGLRVVLVNSNPATIMTDPEFADATYVEPITPEIVEKIIAKERPDAVLATLGGQTALNCAMELHERGILEKYDCPLIGANVIRSINLLSIGIVSFTTRMLDGAEPDEARIAELMNRSLMLVTALAPEIGYDNAAAIAKHAHKKGLTLKEAGLELGLVDEETFDRVVRPEQMIGR